MKADRWSLWDEFIDLRREIDRLFASFSSRIAADSLIAPSFSPEIDIYETRDNIVVRLALPGVIEEDIDICVDGNRITVQGERDLPFDAVVYHHKELQYGMFRRVVELPQSADPNSMRAKLSDGLLEIIVPKR